MHYRISTCFLLFGFFLASCGNATSSTNATSNQTSTIQVNETGTDAPTSVSETIHMNNCGGKADAEQIAERSLTLSVEGEIGIDATIVWSSIKSRYEKGVSKGIRLIAPAGTNMEFLLSWNEQASFGTIIATEITKQAGYRVHVPVGVELVSSKDMMCSTEVAGQSNNEGAISLSPTLTALPATPIPVATRTPDITQEGTVLLSEHWWKGENFDVLLRVNYIYYEQMSVSFLVVSKYHEPFDLTYALGDVTAVTSLGDDLPDRYKRCISQSIKVAPGVTNWLTCDDEQAVVINGINLKNHNIDHVIITLPDFYGIKNAKWRVNLVYTP